MATPSAKTKNICLLVLNSKPHNSLQIYHMEIRKIIWQMFFHFEKIVIFRWSNWCVFTLIRSEQTNQHELPNKKKALRCIFWCAVRGWWCAARPSALRPVNWIGSRLKFAVSPNLPFYIHFGAISNYQWGCKYQCNDTITVIVSLHWYLHPHW